MEEGTDAAVAEPTTAEEPEKVQDRNLTVEAPSGAVFQMEEVKTDRGTRTLGTQPILVWQDVDELIAFYGEEKIRLIVDGTSLRVSFQGISRRFAAAAKSFNEIAQAQIDFRPGSRTGGQSTPATRASKAAKAAAEEHGDKITELLQKVADGELDLDEVLGSLS